MNRRWSAVVAAFGLALLLGGCSAPAGLAVFQREASAQDRLPAGIEEPQDPPLVNSRFLAEADGVRHFAAQAEEGALACLVAVPGGSKDYVAGCGRSMTAGPIVSVSGRGVSAATLVPDGFDTTEQQVQGWRKLQGNLLIGPR
ncbi:hypothetical protein ACTWLI_11375 [Arthrobacter sp. Hor0625]|uniref:hypothetical protein n=1 Tax=Arthrobacter sp. Hor0625 TaxID=3457358 RepID=UPI00403EA2DC